MFIVFEGIDGSGKGTHVNALFEELTKSPEKFDIGNHVAVEKTVEPSDSTVGRLIREYLSGKHTINPSSLALLFTSDRIDNLQDNVVPILNKGGIVLQDRYVYSTIAYQGADGVDTEWVCKINDGIVTPDLVFYLDVSPEESMKRMDDKSSVRSQVEKDVFETMPDFLGDVREIYLDIFNKKMKFSGGYSFLGANVEVIDGRDDIKVISNRINECVKKLINGGYPLRSGDHVKFCDFFGLGTD